MIKEVKNTYRLFGVREKDETFTYPETVFVIHEQFNLLRKTEGQGGVPGDDPLTHKVKIGDSMDTKTRLPLSGLNPDEEERLLPKIIKTKPSSDHWEAKVNEYWNNIYRVVPSDGLKLDASVAFKTKKEAEHYLKHADNVGLGDGYPLNVEDYILYRYCLVYRRVANTPEERFASPKIWFYLMSEQRQKRAEFENTQRVDQAIAQYLEIKKDKKKVENVLRVLEIWDDQMEQDDIDILLQNQALKNTKRFLEVTKNTYNLNNIAFIKKALKLGVLEKLPNTEVIVKDGKTIGTNIDQAAAIMKTEEGAKLKKELENEVSLFEAPSK